jgi:citrate synthase
MSFMRSYVPSSKKIAGFGHRVYKAYDPRARIMEPLAKRLTEENPEFTELYAPIEER